MLWTLAFWRGAAERAIRTFAQTLAGTIGADTLGIMDVNWVSVLSLAGLTTLTSLLMSIGNADFVAGQPVISTKAIKFEDDDRAGLGV